MSDISIEIAEELSKETGISFEQALYIVQSSKIVTPLNWMEWVEDIKKVCELDTINA